MRQVLLLAFFGLGWSAMLGCSSTDSSCEDLGNCAAGTGGASGTGGVGGTGATGGAGGDGGGCDTSKSPSEEACLVTDDHAIFVAPTGTDGAEGTKADPLKSITEAASKAASSGKIVLVCNGSYDEHVMINGGAKVYGGFDCTSWAYESGTKPTVSPSTAGFALEVAAVTTTVAIEDIEFTSKAGDTANNSSIAAFVHDSPSVVLTRVKLEAGTGVNGENGVLVPFTFTKTQADLDGKPGGTPSAANGGVLNVCACPAGDSSSGAAGGNAPSNDGDDGQPAFGGGQGGVVGACNPGGFGKNGNQAPPANDMPGATSLGALSSSGWSPSSGTQGEHGKPGQGGGGGASGAATGGGGGGCGGCGGSGGPGGKGGGASIGLLALGSPVALTDCEVIAHDAGDGGAGAAGQPAQNIFGFGASGAGGGACQGGDGALGRPGGAGGGGAGGVSAAIAYKGEKPTATGGNLVPGEKGGPGVGGKPGTNDGVDGAAGNEVELP